MGRSVKTRVDIIFFVGVALIAVCLVINGRLEHEQVKLKNNRLLLEIQNRQIESLGRKFLQVYSLGRAGEGYAFDIDNLNLEIEPQTASLNRISGVLRKGGVVAIDREERHFFPLPAAEHPAVDEIDLLINAFYFVRADLLNPESNKSGSRLVLLSSVLNRMTAANKNIVRNLEAHAARLDTYLLAARLSTVIIGALALFMFRFTLVRLLLNPLKELSEVLVPMSGGLLRKPRELNRRDEVGELFRHFGIFVEKLRENVAVVQRTSRTVAGESEQLKEISDGISRGVSNQAATAAETSSSMEQVVLLIQESQELAMETKVIADVSNQAAEDGGKAVVESIEAMEQVIKKISVVEQIAQETNLLALNAAVEAARAGEGSKSFAVIAANVRKLAESSKEAAREVSAISAETMKMARRAEDMIHKIGPNTRKTAELVDQISATGTIQTDQARQINISVQQLEDVTRQNANISERMVGTADNLYQEVFRLEEMIDFFRLEDENKDASGEDDSPGEES